VTGKLSISARDRTRLETASRILLSPLDHGGVDAWRLAANRQLKGLLGADMVTFLLPQADGPLAFSEEVQPQTLQQYTFREPAIPGGRSIWERQVELGVWSRASVYGHLLPEYYRSEYYNEFCIPARGYDSIGISLSIEARPRAGAIAGLMFHHDTPRGARFGQRGLHLLRLLLPAVEAGIRAYLCLARYADDLTRTLDTLGQAILIANHTGRVLHRTPALERLLGEDPEGARILEQVQLVVRSLTTLTPPRAGDPPLSAATRDVRTRVARYRLYSSHHLEPLTAGPLILVSVERLTPEPLPDDMLRERFGLTRAEIRVARLLGDGKTNAEIAEALVISPHTAERHTERILHKLGVRSRAAVGAVLLKG
jgi:DNA-binding CsgD family transcriptional regulator/PAS domain-containing protein